MQVLIIQQNSSDRTRTCDPGLMNPLLCQLSYAAVFTAIRSSSGRGDRGVILAAIEAVANRSRVSGWNISWRLGFGGVGWGRGALGGGMVAGAGGGGAGVAHERRAEQAASDQAQRQCGDGGFAGFGDCAMSQRLNLPGKPAGGKVKQSV